MLCKKCQRYAEEGQSKCPHCGAPIESAASSRGSGNKAEDFLEKPAREVASLKELKIPGQSIVFSATALLMVLALVIVLLFGVFKVREGAEGHAMFRANPQRTGAYETEGVETLRSEKWKFITAGSVDSSPCVADGLVYFGSNDGYLYVLD